MRRLAVALATALSCTWSCSGESPRSGDEPSAPGGSDGSGGDATSAASYAGEKSGDGGFEEFATGGAGGAAPDVQGGEPGASSAGQGGTTGSGGGLQMEAGSGGEEQVGGGGLGGAGPQPPDGDPCDYPASDFAYDCGDVCDAVDTGSKCDCNWYTGTSEYSTTLLFNGEDSVCNTCAWAGVERGFEIRVSKQACARLTSMDDSGVGYVLDGCQSQPVSGCQIVSSTVDGGNFTYPQIQLDLPAWPVWVRVEVAHVGGSPGYECPLTCP